SLRLRAELRYLRLASIFARTPRATRFRRTIGVLPITSRMLLCHIYLGLVLRYHSNSFTRFSMRASLSVAVAIGRLLIYTFFTPLFKRARMLRAQISSGATFASKSRFKSAMGKGKNRDSISSVFVLALR